VEGYDHDVYGMILLQNVVGTEVRAKGEVMWVEKEDGMVLGQE
jgi:hypothetical protein